LKCPFCKAENIDGADECEACGRELAGIETVFPKPIERSIAATPLKQVPAPPPVEIPPTATVAELTDRLIAGNVGAALVVHGGKLMGIVSERDLLLKVGERFDACQHEPVSNYMKADPETLGPEATVAWALNRMDVGGFRHIPIVDNGRPQGMVSVKDLLVHLASENVDLPA
jgi:CBS domain-containing protein